MRTALFNPSLKEDGKEFWKIIMKSYKSETFYDG